MLITENKTGSFDDVAGTFYRMQCGDTSAFDELYKMTVKYVQYTVMGAGVPSADVEDVVQNTYIYIFNNYESCREPRAALSWIKKVAFSRSIDYLRKTSKETLLSEEDGDYVFEDSTLIAPIEMPEDVVENNETRRLVNEMLNKLPEKQLTIVRAFYFNEKKTREIAEEMGIPEGTVKASLARSRKTLEGELNSFAKKHGVKLVATAIVPVLSMVFTEEAHACVISTASMSSMYKAAVLGSRAKDLGVAPVISSVSSTAASTGANVAAASAAKTGAAGVAKIGGATFGKAFATKVAVAVVAAAVVVPGSVVAVNTMNKTAAEQQQVQSVEAREIQYSNDISDEAKRLEHEMELQRLQDAVQSASSAQSQAVVAPPPASASVAQVTPSSVAPSEEEEEEEEAEEKSEAVENNTLKPSNENKSIQDYSSPQYYCREVEISGKKYFIDDTGKKYEFGKDYNYSNIPRYDINGNEIQNGGTDNSVNSGVVIVVPSGTYQLISAPNIYEKMY